MESRTILRCAALAGATAVLLGAFAAHGLKSRLADADLATFETGVRYQMYHALALGLAALRGRLRLTPWLLLAGIALFSGSLYGLALTGIRAFGPVTPFGGIAFVLGWLCLGWERTQPAPSDQVQR